MEQEANCTPSASCRLIHRGAKFDFVEIEIPSRSGTTLKRQFVRHPGAVVILPLLEQEGRPDQVVMIRNLRHALGMAILELPAGTLESGETPQECAGRELEEETGYRAATLIPLGRFHTSPGLSNEIMHAFGARGLEFVGERREPDETMTVDCVEAKAIGGMIMSGELSDAKSIVAVHLAAGFGLIPK